MSKSKKRPYVRKAVKEQKPAITFQTLTLEELRKMIEASSRRLDFETSRATVDTSAGTGDLKIPASTATVNNSILDLIFVELSKHNDRLDSVSGKLIGHLARILGPQGVEDVSKKLEKDGAATNWSGLAYEINKHVIIQADKLVILEGLIERLAYA